MSQNPGIEHRFVDATLKPAQIGYIDHERDLIILLMGPTGVGKSRFIEMLAGNDDLGISKDQLDGYTQAITTYELVDLPPSGEISGTDTYDDRRVYIIDSPGFSDSQISEMEIVEMVHKWMVTFSVNIHSILYLYSIADTRLPGSKRRTIKMMQLLTGIGTDTPGTVGVVTTMWDRLWNERGKRAAEERFAQLRDFVWTDRANADNFRVMTKFWNTHESALDIVNTIINAKDEHQLTNSAFDAYDPQFCGKPNDATFTPYLYQDLLDRIHTAQQQSHRLGAEITEPELQTNAELKRLLEDQLQRNNQLLAKFEFQLVQFGDPPEGFEHVAQLLVDIRKKHYPEYLTSPPQFPPQSKFDPLKVSSNSVFKRVLGRGIEAVKASIKRRG